MGQLMVWVHCLSRCSCLAVKHPQWSERRYKVAPREMAWRATNSIVLRSLRVFPENSILDGFGVIDPILCDHQIYCGSVIHSRFKCRSKFKGCLPGNHWI